MSDKEIVHLNYVAALYALCLRGRPTDRCIEVAELEAAEDE